LLFERSSTHIAIEGLAAFSLKHFFMNFKAIWAYRVSWHAHSFKLDEPNFTPVGIFKLSSLFKTETFSYPLPNLFLFCKIKPSKVK
jgi:hypothetical protein